jgi:GrpB-like predicted nucleotidyltransferase (UPF0157 family)
LTNEQKKELERALWAIANTLRGKMNADEFRDYILGFIFYKYLSERLHLYANEVLQQDGITFEEIDEDSPDGEEILAAVKEASLGALGYFLKPSELFNAIAKRGAQPGEFILSDLSDVLYLIQESTLGAESQEDFDNLFEDLDLSSSKLGRTEKAKNDLVVKVLTSLDSIDFRLGDADSDVLGDAYEYLIGQFAAGAGKKAGEFYTPQQVSTILARIPDYKITRVDDLMPWRSRTSGSMTGDPASLGLRQATLALAPHDPAWADAFDAEASRIRAALPDMSFEIDHIGSTAVPGLPAKPILDIAMRAGADDELRIADALVDLGYIDRGLRSGRLFIRMRDGNVRTHNLHLYHPDDPDCRNQIAFRDALRDKPDLRDRYAALKQDLVNRLGDAGRGRYADEKTDFVQTAILQSR